jgi:hypothetical protein
MTVTFRSYSTGQADGSKTLTISKPSGVISGDVMLAFFYINPNGQTVTPPSGWTLIANTTYGGNDTAYAAYKIAGSSEPTSYSWTVSGGNGAWGAAIACYTGNSPGVDVASSAWSTSSANPLTTASVTNAKGGVLVFAEVNYSSAGAASITGPTGFTNRFDLIADATFDNFAEILVADIARGAVGATGSVTTTTSSSFFANAGIFIQLYDLSSTNGLFFGALI